MTRLRNMNLSVFLQCQYTRTILRNKSIGQNSFKKHSKFQWNILLWHDQTQEHKFWCFYTMSIHKNHFKKQKYGAESVWETFKISKFQWNILLWHDQTQEHEFGCFYTMSAHKPFLRNKIMGQSLFKKYSKF